MSIEQELMSFLRYEVETGNFYWTDLQHKAVRGKLAGSIDGHGYRNLSLRGKKFKAHRVAWLFATGEWPADEIDHINGNKQDNRIVNLREATSQLNKWNHKKAQSNNSTGYRGVSKHRDKFMADIKVNGKKIYLGLFDTPELAHEAYIQAKKTHHKAVFAKPWVGLTEPERLACYDLNPALFASNIEAKLREKNNG